MPQHVLIWTGGQPGDPEDGRLAEAIPLLPDPEPLPRAALVTHWWGQARFQTAVYACSIHTTPWGNREMTWLHIKGKQMTDGVIDGSAPTMNLLVPTQYITGVRPGPDYKLASRGPAGAVGLFPPSQPAPPHVLPLSEIERAFAGLSAAATESRGFSVAYPLFALRRPDGEYVGFGPHGNRSEAGPGFGYAVFTNEADAGRFLRDFERRSRSRGIRLEPFDRFAVFRGFLRSLRDSEACILFDPAHRQDGVLYADHVYPAAVVLERFLPQVAWGWSYPVHVLRAAGPGITLHTTEGHRPEDNMRVPILPVFTDADLADRALALASPGAMVLAVPDSETFARLIRTLPAGFAVVFDHEPARGPVGKIVLNRDDLLANLEIMEL